MYTKGLVQKLEEMHSRLMEQNVCCGLSPEEMDYIRIAYHTGKKEGILTHLINSSLSYREDACRKDPIFNEGVLLDIIIESHEAKPENLYLGKSWNSEKEKEEGKKLFALSESNIALFSYSQYQSRGWGNAAEEYQQLTDYHQKGYRLHDRLQAFVYDNIYNAKCLVVANFDETGLCTIDQQTLDRRPITICMEWDRSWSEIAPGTYDDVCYNTAEIKYDAPIEVWNHCRTPEQPEGKTTTYFPEGCVKILPEGTKLDAIDLSNGWFLVWVPGRKEWVYMSGSSYDSEYETRKSGHKYSVSGPYKTSEKEGDWLARFFGVEGIITPAEALCTSIAEFQILKGAK